MEYVPDEVLALMFRGLTIHNAPIYDMGGVLYCIADDVIHGMGGVLLMTSQTKKVCADTVADVRADPTFIGDTAIRIAVVGALRW